MRTRQGLALDGRTARLLRPGKKCALQAPRGARSAVRCVTLTVGLFGELGHEHPLTMRYRRRLAASLY